MRNGHILLFSRALTEDEQRVPVYLLPKDVFTHYVTVRIDSADLDELRVKLDQAALTLFELLRRDKGRDERSAE